MSTYTFPLAKGGFELLVTANFSSSTPDTREDPGDPEEFEVTKVELVAERSPRGGSDLMLDVTDLVYDLADDEGEAFNEAAYEAFQAWCEDQTERDLAAQGG